MNIENLTAWTQAQLNLPNVTLQPLYGDMSQRRYFRAKAKQSTWIVADSSAEATDLPAFIAMDHALAKLGLYTPEIIRQDLTQGLLIQQDFGDQSLLQTLSSSHYESHYEQWYDLALADLVRLQMCKTVENYTPPQYDSAAITLEFNIFVEWYLTKYHKMDVTQHQALLTQTLNQLIHVMHEQPSVLIHRDYHSRNLMVIEQNKLGVIDFQGAKWGPMTYDPVSLLKDCYINWPLEFVQRKVQELQPKLWNNVTLPEVSNAEFFRWFELTGLQRHLKVLGQIPRKLLRDNTDYYMADLPRVEQYVLDVCARYAELDELHKLLRELICAR